MPGVLGLITQTSIVGGYSSDCAPVDEPYSCAHNCFSGNDNAHIRSIPTKSVHLRFNGRHRVVNCCILDCEWFNLLTFVSHVGA